MPVSKCLRRCRYEDKSGNLRRDSVSGSSRRMAMINLPCVATRAFILLILYMVSFTDASGGEENWRKLYKNQEADDEDGQCHGPKIVHVTDATFQNFDDGYLLLLYYSDWSGNSKKILPFWATLAQELDEAGVAITVGLIDSTQNRQNLASRYVHTLPQIFIFHGGQIVAHLVNERTLDDLKAAVVTVTELSESDLDDRKAEVLKQLEDTEAERSQKLQDEEMLHSLAALKFESQVTTLHKDNFYALTSKTDAVVFVYTLWCEHCKVMKADWLELAKDPQIPGVLVAKINLDDFSTFPGARLLEGVPSVLFFRDAAIYGYFNGSRNLEDLRIWANLLTSLTTEELKELVKELQEEEARNLQKAKDELIYEQALLKEEFDDILELSEDNFDGLTRGKSALILFYSERGERSQLMKPVWVSLSKQKELTGLLIARFPESDYRWRHEMEYIHGYPTVLFARNGVIIERYEGVQQLGELYHYAKTLLALSTEEARQKHAHLARTLQREKLMERERDRARHKAESKRREEETRKERQQKRKKKARTGTSTF
ncbi:hypothetical protein MPTK2_1g22150 [Marchantia polymorpha subsp. ruderalis]